MSTLRFKALSAALALAGLCTAAAAAQQLPVEGPVATTALINVESKSNAALNPASLRLRVNDHDAAIASVTPITRQGAQVAILIDDGLRGSFDVQVKDLKSFINTLPRNVQVLVGYMQNGTVRHEGGFSVDHAAVAKNIRIPLSDPGVSASPYFCLQDIVKHWPGDGNAARIVLMITNGVDPYNGSVSPLNQDSPYVQSAQNDAQRHGVAVYSIYWGNSGIGGGFANFSGQSYLNQVAEATGGISFFQGRITPPSLSPYLRQFGSAIAESYLVTFNASANHEKSNTLTSIKLTTDQPGIKIHAPKAVHPGLSEEATE